MHGSRAVPARSALFRLEDAMSSACADTSVDFTPGPSPSIVLARVTFISGVVVSQSPCLRLHVREHLHVVAAHFLSQTVVFFSGVDSSATSVFLQDHGPAWHGLVLHKKNLHNKTLWLLGFNVVLQCPKPHKHIEMPGYGR